MTEEHPTLKDFSSGATKKAVLTYSIQNPLTLYSTGAGLLGTLAVGLFGISVFPASIALGGLSVGALSWAYHYLLKGDKIAARYAESLLRDLETHREEVIAKVSKDLTLLTEDPKLTEFASQALKQFKMISDSFEAIRSTLSDKLKPSELTYGRYISSAEQVFLAVLDNAVVITSILKTLSRVDTAYIQERISSLEKLSNPDEADRQEHRTILERLQLYENQISKVNNLITKNEVAITEMDKMCAALTELRTVRGQAQVDLESAISEMEQLAKRVQTYSMEEG
jgi:hypothetical protein